MALVYPAPHSYTGQDSIELLVPGNPDLVTRIIDHLIQIDLKLPSPFVLKGRGQGEGYLGGGNRTVGGVRLATPGEFTARAFHTGRISLTQAEGVAATIAARTDAEVRAAHHLRSGTLAKSFSHLSDDLANALALVEAGIDFTDQEDVHPIPPPQLARILDRLQGALTDMLDRGVGVERLHDVPTVVLLGRPNAGKSTLFNALLGRPRAVVSPTAGSTRDILAEPLHVPTPHGPAEVLLIDMPGLDVLSDSRPRSPLDEAMHAAAHQATRSADLVLLCAEAEAELDRQLVHSTTNADLDTALPPHVPVIHVVTKRDGPSAAIPAAPPRSVSVSHSGSHGPRTVSVSALHGIGLDALRAAIAEAVAGRTVSLGADALALSARHEAAMHTAREHLEAALGILRSSADARMLPEPELLAASMRAALDEFGSVVGTITSDDVLGRIFSSFCIGK